MFMQSIPFSYKNFLAILRVLDNCEHFYYIIIVTYF